MRLFASIAVGIIFEAVNRMKDRLNLDMASLIEDGYNFKHVEVSYTDEHERYPIFESDKLSDLGEAQREYLEAVRKAREG